MPYNLGELKTRTLRSLGRPTDDDTIAEIDLVQTVNVSRAEAWRQCGGPIPDLLTMDLVNGQRDYSIGDYRQTFYGIASVAAKNTGQQLVQLEYLPATEMLAYYKTDVTTGFPTHWTYLDGTVLRESFPNELPWRLVGGEGPTIAVWPVPDASISDGLVVEVASAARALANDADVSVLPTVVDEAACYLAACEIAYGDLFDDPGVQARLSVLEGRARQAVSRARWAVNNLFGGIVRLTPTDSFGSTDVVLKDNRWPSNYSQTEDMSTLG